jgi:putative FmdB family regulatory protein
MPIYEYECKSCSLRFELTRRFGENSGASCPQCQGEALRLFSPVPIIFKGPGFYVTDKAAEEAKQFGSRWDGGKSPNGDESPKPAKEGKGKAIS